MSPKANRPSRPPHKVALVEGTDLEAIDNLGPFEDSVNDPRTLRGPVRSPIGPGAKEKGPTMAAIEIAPLPKDIVAGLEFDDAAGEPCKLSKNVTVVGRVASAADFVLPWNEEASREHLAILFFHGQFFLEDLHSNNGTFVNDERVERVQLKSGDRIRIGSQVLVFRCRG